MKFTVLKFVFLFCSITFAPVIFAQYNWKLSKDRDGIKVFESGLSNSVYKCIKVECTLDGNYNKLINVLSDVSHHKEWIYNNRKAYLIKRISPFEFYYYSETYLPWPLSNRDAVAHMKINRDSLNRFVNVVEVGEPKYIAENTGIVRVPRFSVNWHVTMPSENKLDIVYILEIEPGGSLPAWLVNMFVDKGPFESFKKLAEILKHS